MFASSDLSDGTLIKPSSSFSCVNTFLEKQVGTNQFLLSKQAVDLAMNQGAPFIIVFVSLECQLVSKLIAQEISVAILGGRTSQVKE